MKLIRNNLIITSNYDLYDIKNLKIGTAVELDIFIKKNEDFHIIIEAGTILTEKLYANIIRYEKIYILKKDIDNETITHNNLISFINQNSGDLKKVINILYDFNNKFFDNFLNSKGDTIDLESANSIIKSTIFLVKDKQEFLRDAMPYFSVGNKLADHSLHVAIYAIKLATLLDFNNDDLKEMVRVTAKLTIAHCKEVFTECIIKNRPLDEVVKEMHRLGSEKLHSDDKFGKAKLGFGEKNEGGWNDGYDDIEDWGN